MKKTTIKQTRKKPQATTRKSLKSSPQKKKGVKHVRKWSWQNLKLRICSLFMRDGELSPWSIWGGVLLVGITYIIIVYFFSFRPYLWREEVQELYFLRPYVHGIDVSHHQGEIDWDKVCTATFRERPIHFVFMKATEGGDFVDENFQHNFATAREKGLVCGAYHFFLPDVSAEVQARNFISQVTLQPGDLPPVLDIEVMGKDGAEQLQQSAAEWLRIVEHHYGVAPIIYASYKFKTRYLDNEPFSHYPCWIAHYYVEDLKYEGDWNFWQHTDRGRLDGIDARVDLNIFNGNLEELKMLTVR